MPIMTHPHGWFLQTNHIQKVEKKWYDDSYMFGFISCLTFRNSCYSCRYATGCRVSDITIADFWGIHADAGLQIGKGVSSCLLNTEKGESFFASLKDILKSVEREVVEAIKGNGQLQRPSRCPLTSALFHRLYLHKSFKEAIAQSLKKEYIKVRYIKPSVAFFKNIIKQVSHVIK